MKKEETHEQKVRTLEQTYLSMTDVNSHACMDAYLSWHSAALLYLSKYYSDSNPDFSAFKHLDNSGNGYSLRTNFKSINSIYNLLMEGVKNQEGHFALKVEKKTPKIFISHNTEDRAYAKAIVELMAKIGVRYDDIFCSSFPGCGVIFGNGILNAIREQFEEYNLFVLFIHSPRFYSSAVSLNEMGAAWILKSDHRSFLTSDCEFNMLKGVIKSDEAAFKAGQDNTYHLLHDFRKVLEKFFNLAPINDATWEIIKNDFVNTVKAINNQQSVISNQ